MNILTGETGSRQKPADTLRMERKLSYQHMQLHKAFQDSRGGSEMELLLSQQEIICLIKDFPPSYSLGQSEVLRQGETEMIKRAPWAFRAGQRWLPCLHSRAKEDLFNPIGKV